MTGPTAAGPPVTSVPPEALLGGAERRSDVAVMRALKRVVEADRNRSWVRRWAGPVFCVVFGIPALQDARDGTGTGPGVPTLLVLMAAFCIPLLWRQQRPILVFALTSVVSSVALTLDAATGSEAARVLALLNVGRSSRPVQLAVCVAVAVAQTSVNTVLRDEGPDIGLQTPVVAIIQSALVAAVAAAGLVGRVVNAYIRALHERALRLEVERDQRARLAAAAERARVAREMHDILGHTLAVIVGLANGAAGLTEAKPKRGAETLRIIADSGRGALAELRRLLAVIGDDEKTTAEGTPSPLSRASTTSPRCWSASAPPAPPSPCAPRATAPTCRPASSSPSTASSRRPSPTPSSTRRPIRPSRSRSPPTTPPWTSPSRTPDRRCTRA